MRLTSKIFVPIGVVLAIGAAAVAYFSQSFIANQLKQNQFSEQIEETRKTAETVLTEDDFANPEEKISQTSFQKFIRHSDETDIRSVFIWNRDYELIASDALNFKDLTVSDVTRKELKSVYESKNPQIFENSGREKIPDSPDGSADFVKRRLFIPIVISGKIQGVIQLNTTDLVLDQLISAFSLYLGLIIFIQVFIVFVVCAFFMHFAILKPLGILTKAANEAPFTGRLELPAVVKSRKDEIGGLALSFESMFATLQKTFQQLKEKQESAERAKKETEKKNRELEDSKRAVLNLLNDFKKAQKRERLAHEAVTLQKERAESILNYLQSIAEAVFATDISGNIVFINRTAKSLLPEEERNHVELEKANEVFRFVEGEGKKKKPVYPVVLALERSDTFRFPKSSYFRTRQKDIPVDGICSPFAREGKNLGAICVFQDITERHNLEKEKDDFLSIAAHQLRTPLSGIRWMVESLIEGDDGELPAEAKATLDQIYENNQRLIILVNDLLDVSRINMGKSKEEPVSINICKMLKDAVESLAGLAKERNVSVSFEKICALNPEVRFGPRHLFQTLENLISNAIKYTPERGRVRIWADFKEDKVIIGISDTGIGIPKNEQDKIFKKFFRASNAALVETEGSGLGLNVVKSFVEEAGGRIWFESEEKKGTTFFVELPAA